MNELNLPGRSEKLPIPEDNFTAEELVELIQKKYSKDLTRREFNKFGALTGAALLIPTIRGISNETTDWRSNAYKLEDLMHSAMQIPESYEHGCWPDERGRDRWENPNLLRSAAEREDKIGVFFNLEMVEGDKFEQNIRDFISNLYYIRSRGSEPIISIHVSQRPGGKHPFHPENREWMIRLIKKFFEILDKEFPYPVVLRPFYEMNIPYAFAYSKDDTISQHDHELSYKQILRAFAEQKFKSRYSRKLAFCASTIYDFSRYWIPPQAGYSIFDERGLDGYNIYPGDILQLLEMNVSFINLIQLLGYYFIEGDKSPEQIFEHRLQQMNALPGGHLPTYLYELNCRKDPEWVNHATWLAAVYGCRGAFPFIYNKEYQILKYNKPFEANWAKYIQRLAELYAITIPMLNSRVQRVA